MNLPGLNTLGISMSRLDFAPDSMFSPHYHPHASEILVFIEGTLEVGFVSSTNNLFMKVSKKGNAYMFPQGLIHSQYNPGKTNGVAFSGLNSQNPGAVFVAKAVLGRNPQSLLMCLPRHSNWTRKLLTGSKLSLPVSINLLRTASMETTILNWRSIY